MRQLNTLLLLSLVGCEAEGHLYYTPGDSGPFDADADADTDTDTDTDTDADMPQADFSEWNGNSVYSHDLVGGCEENVSENGPEIIKADSRYADLVAACLPCQHFYQVDLDTDSVCDDTTPLELENPVVRGLSISGATASVYQFDEGAAVLLDSGTWDGLNIEYAYMTDYNIDVAATAHFDEM